MEHSSLAFLLKKCSLKAESLEAPDRKPAVQATRNSVTIQSDGIYYLLHGYLAALFNSAKEKDAKRFAARDLGGNLGRKLAILANVSRIASQSKKTIQVVEYIFKILWQQLFKNQSSNLAIVQKGNEILVEQKNCFFLRFIQAEDVEAGGQYHSLCRDMLGGLVDSLACALGLECRVEVEEMKGSVLYRIVLQGNSMD